MNNQGRKGRKGKKDEQAAKSQDNSPGRNEIYERELARLQVELSHLQPWFKETGAWETEKGRRRRFVPVHPGV